MHQTYGDDFSAGDPSVQLKVGGSLYAWGAYEKPDLFLVGQEIGSAEILSVGVGYRYDGVFIEFGYFEPDVSTVQNIRDEGVTTTLNNHHGWAGTRRFDDTTYDIKGGYGGRIGVSHRMSKRLSVQASYRFLTLTEEMDATVGVCGWPEAEESPDCESWWQERDDTDLGAFEVGLFFRF